MDSQAIQAKIAELSAALNTHNHAYYVLNQPLISDFEFDALLKELESLEQQYPQFANPNSPTKRVGGDLTKKFETKPHRFPMLSLSNSYSEQDIIDWAERCQKTLQAAFEFVCELKDELIRHDIPLRICQVPLRQCSGATLYRFAVRSGGGVPICNGADC